jgi:hypothetical protein
MLLGGGLGDRHLLPDQLQQISYFCDTDRKRFARLLAGSDERVESDMIRSSGRSDSPSEVV